MFGFQEAKADAPEGLPYEPEVPASDWMAKLLPWGGKLLKLVLVFGAAYWMAAALLPMVLAWWFVHIVGRYVPLHPGMEAALGMVSFAIFTKYGFRMFIRPRSDTALAWLVLAICGAIGLNIARHGGTSFPVDKRFYAMTERGPVFSDTPGKDAESGQPLKELTPDARRLLRRMLTEQRMRLDPVRSDLFDGLTGDPIAFYIERNGETEFYNAPGVDTRAGEWLQPVSKEYMRVYWMRKQSPAEAGAPTQSTNEDKETRR